MSLPVVGSDYCTCELVAATNASATTLLVSTPTNNFPTLGAGEYWYLTIVDAASYEIDANPPVQREIVKVTAVATVSTGFSLTCVRGSGDTTAQIWASGSIAEIRPCQQWFEDLKSTGGADWLLTDGIVSVTPVDQLFVGATGAATVEVTDLGGGAAALVVGAPVGATGATGATGAVGATGATGAVGATGATGPASDLLSNTVTMTSADLLAWYDAAPAGNPFEFVPAPDNSHFLLPLTTVFTFDPVGTPYSTAGARCVMYYTDGTGLAMSDFVPMTLLEETDAAFVTTDNSFTNAGYLITYAQAAGKPLVGVIDEPLTLGNGELEITTYYFLRQIQAPS